MYVAADSGSGVNNNTVIPPCGFFYTPSDEEILNPAQKYMKQI